MEKGGHDMRKRSTLSIIWAVMCVGLSGFTIGDKLVTKHKKETNIANAKENAAVYLADKYGIQIQSAEVSDEKYHVGYNSYLGRTELKVTADGEEFFVLSSIEPGKTENCCDDRQIADIYEAAEKYVREGLPGCQVEHMRLSSDVYYDMMKDGVVFNGDNIEEVLGKCSGYIDLVIADTSFTGNSFIEDFPGNGDLLQCISFDSGEIMQQYLNIDDADNSSLYGVEMLQYFAPYINDFYKIYDSEVNRLDIKIMETNEFSCAYFPVEKHSWQTDQSIKAEYSPTGKLLKSFDRCGAGERLDKPITAESQFDSGYGNIFVYYPLSSFGDISPENTGLAWFSYGGQVNDRNICKPRIIGDYAVYVMPYGENRFMLVDLTGKDEYIPGWAAKK